MSNLLRMARSRDDEEFILRVGAALTVHAQTLDKELNLSVASRALVDWVLANPMTAMDKVYAFVSTVPAIAAKIELIDGRVNTAAVTDDEIIAAISAKWDQIASFVAKRNQVVL